MSPIDNVFIRYGGLFKKCVHYQISQFIYQLYNFVLIGTNSPTHTNIMNTTLDNIKDIISKKSNDRRLIQKFNAAVSVIKTNALNTRELIDPANANAYLYPVGVFNFMSLLLDEHNNSVTNSAPLVEGTVPAVPASRALPAAGSTEAALTTFNEQTATATLKRYMELLLITDASLARIDATLQPAVLDLTARITAVIVQANINYELLKCLFAIRDIFHVLISKEDIDMSKINDFTNNCVRAIALSADDRLVVPEMETVLTADVNGFPEYLLHDREDLIKLIGIIAAFATSCGDTRTNDPTRNPGTTRVIGILTDLSNRNYFQGTINDFGIINFPEKHEHFHLISLLIRALHFIRNGHPPNNIINNNITLYNSLNKSMIIVTNHLFRASDICCDVDNVLINTRDRLNQTLFTRFTETGDNIYNIRLGVHNANNLTGGGPQRGGAIISEETKRHDTLEELNFWRINKAKNADASSLINSTGNNIISLDGVTSLYFKEPKEVTGNNYRVLFNNAKEIASDMNNCAIDLLINIMNCQLKGIKEAISTGKIDKISQFHYLPVTMGNEKLGHSMIGTLSGATDLKTYTDTNVHEIPENTDTQYALVTDRSRQLINNNKVFGKDAHRFIIGISKIPSRVDFTDSNKLKELEKSLHETINTLNNSRK